MNKDSVLPQSLAIGEVSQTLGGLTKRELYAAMAMQGLLANEDITTFSELASDAVSMADKLINALEKKNV